jgi:hypothetical protein
VETGRESAGGEFESNPPPLFEGETVGEVEDTSGKPLLVETGRESLVGVFESKPPPPFEGETVGEVEETVGDEMEELRPSEETLVGRTVEDVGPPEAIEEDGTALALGFCPLSVTVT